MCLPMPARTSTNAFFGPCMSTAASIMQAPRLPSPPVVFWSVHVHSRLHHEGCLSYHARAVQELKTEEDMQRLGCLHPKQDL